MKNKFPLVLLLIIITASSIAQIPDNLLKTSLWSSNIGPLINAGGFYANGSSTQNSIIWDTDPFMKKALIWKSISDGNNGPNGGWEYPNIPIDPKKAYRSTVWIKKGNRSGSGFLYLGCDCSNTLNLDNSENSNPYFTVIGNVNNTLTEGKWYLLVGYIHASTDNDNNSYGGIYDGETGQKIASTIDFKSKNSATTQNHRTFNFYDTQAGSSAYWYAPRFEEMNGSEPSIEQLLGLVGQAATNNKNSFFGGNVGIGTTNPTEKLSVNGNIRTRKVIVTQTGWPDYVFEPTYQLPSLDSVHNFIKENKHLPGMASAAVVEKEGLDLGEIVKQQQQKIEELMLYMIEMKKENERQQAIIESQNKRIEQLEKK